MGTIETVTPPASTDLLLADSVLRRLALPDSERDTVEEQIEEVSSTVAGYLRFQPAYGVWRETFLRQRGSTIYLTNRPVWEILSITDLDGTPFTAPFRLGLPARLDLMDRFAGTFSLANLPSSSASTLAPPLDYVVTYRAGWWLETMAGERPADVATLPSGIRRDFLLLMRFTRALEKVNPMISKTQNEGVMVEFKERAAYSEEGLPQDTTAALDDWRIPL